MTQELTSEPDKPLNPRQVAYGRELGIAMARGDRNFTQAYATAGYKADRGNAARLAADPRVKAIADKICEESLRLAGVHVGYLQAKAMELLEASPTGILRQIGKFLKVTALRDGDNTAFRYALRDDLTAVEMAELDAAAWPLSKLKIDKDGVIAIDLPDKKAIIEMLCKQLGVGKEESTVNVGVSLESLVLASQKANAQEAA